ncbi:MAG TPA: DUF4038 domain-containing protein [Candidatus Hydrogenedentes bacterium]|mgnify:CR=1 FL=1|nr:DUF4038 domain-containing protein [Candidatus Hydrogenedentota bacterium]HOV74298.1 DUF4038 domain-containing protein [Candidatus Hydrogenedentota bacterium]
MQLFATANQVCEITFTSSARYDDPYNEIEMEGVFHHPDGRTFKIPAFWRGGGRWAIRFSPPDVGEYTFETKCSRAADRGLHGVSGKLAVGAYTGENPLYRHGRLRVAADKRHFEHADGTPFFWMGDTWWMGLSQRLDWPNGFQMLAADRVAKGFNVVQIIAGPYPDMDAWDARGRNEAGFPFAADFARVNPAYFDMADLKIAHLADTGLMPCIVGMWGYYMPRIGEERIKRYWRYLVARYGAYPVAWCICGEGTMAYYLSKTPKEDAAAQKTGWTHVMAYVREIDGHHNLISIHPTQYGREQVEDPALMDFEMLQTGHGDLDSVAPTAETVIAAMGRTPAMPVVNSEVNYEGILGRCWQNVQRLCFYVSALNGVAGYTYGANGIWQMSTRENPYGPSPHGRCWGNTPWRDAMLLPGGKQAAWGASFMRRFPWWEMERRPEWVEPAWKRENPYTCTAAGIPGKLRVIYTPMAWDPPLVKGLEPGVAYRAYYADPCTGTDHPIGDVTPDAEGNWRPPIPPEVHDWLLVLTAM